MWWLNDVVNDVFNDFVVNNVVKSNHDLILPITGSNIRPYCHYYPVIVKTN